MRVSIILPILAYASDMDEQCNTAVTNSNGGNEQSERNMWCVKMERESNENLYEIIDIDMIEDGVNQGVVEWVQRSPVRWFVHDE